MPQYTLRIDCPDHKGLVHKITGVLYHHDLNVLRNDEFVSQNGHFFMHTEFEGECQEQKLTSALMGILPDHTQISLSEKRVKNVVLLATKEHHCLSDLLVRSEYKDLNMNVLAVIANHETLRSLTERFGVPFHYVSHEGKTREAHEAEVLAAIAPYGPDYLILAKYMRILTPNFERNYPCRIVNIHHSFLPAFIGANPYKQAYERGVKIVGATAHFVNENLDEGPIITQDIVRVNHALSWQEMAQAGRDVEKVVLAKALKYVLEDKVFIKDNKTVIFE